jgi:phosphopantothenoylcysteine synthetase/decarboxylase
MSELKGRKLVLGVTGGVAAYKAAELVRLLGKAGPMCMWCSPRAARASSRR